jgi:hypothetical protein
MRRLAPRARHCRPRRQDRSSDGLDDDQEWDVADARLGTLRRVRYRGSKPVISAEPWIWSAIDARTLCAKFRATERITATGSIHTTILPECSASQAVPVNAPVGRAPQCFRRPVHSQPRKRSSSDTGARKTESKPRAKPGQGLERQHLPPDGGSYEIPNGFGWCVGFVHAQLHYWAMLVRDIGLELACCRSSSRSTSSWIQA